MKISQLNSKEKFWNYLGGLLQVFFFDRAWRYLPQLIKQTTMVFNMIRINMTKIQKLKWEKRFLLFVFEIFFNFCRMFEFLSGFEDKTSSIEIENSNLFFKEILLFMKKSISGVIKTRASGKDVCDEDRNIRHRKHDTDFSWKYLNIFNENAFKHLHIQKAEFLKDISHVHEFLHINGSFLNAKIIEKIIEIYLEIYNFSTEIQNISRNNSGNFQADFVREINQESPNFSSSLTFAKSSSLFPGENAKKEIWNKCSVCKILPSGLHVWCLKCNHLIHYNHILQNVVNESYKCENCVDCECLTKSKIQTF